MLTTEKCQQFVFFFLFFYFFFFFFFFFFFLIRIILTIYDYNPAQPNINRPKSYETIHLPPIITKPNTEPQALQTKLNTFTNCCQIYPNNSIYIIDSQFQLTIILLQQNINITQQSTQSFNIACKPSVLASFNNNQQLVNNFLGNIMMFQFLIYLQTQMMSQSFDKVTIKKSKILESIIYKFLTQISQDLFVNFILVLVLLDKYFCELTSIQKFLKNISFVFQCYYCRDITYIKFYSTPMCTTNHASKFGVQQFSAVFFLAGLFPPTIFISQEIYRYRIFKNCKYILIYVYINNNNNKQLFNVKIYYFCLFLK
eukprot:TRINITY_DN334_c0_g1_i3.p2 TRINITY_DN334_c0_g1~~TRINITY_DN334_c0_g1_i3.p2  ORF type:complete len:313 (-),score=-29.96 TRINITY_DN334_c0_g1_i3:669-1607(-)